MDILDAVRQWICSFPQWEQGNLVYIDHTDGVPGNLGLFPGGLELVSHRRDILGGQVCRYRYNFALYRVGSQPGDGQDAAWLLEFQRWVMAQSDAGLAPVLGEDTRWRAEKGKLQQRKQPGTGLYVVVLSAEFTNNYGF